MGICSGISTKWLFIHCFQVKLKFRSVDLCGGRKTEEPGEKPCSYHLLTSSVIYYLTDARQHLLILCN